MKQFSFRLLFFVSATLFALFLCSPDTVQRAAYESLLFCGAVLVPSLFPGFVLSDLLISLYPASKGTVNGWFFRIFRLPSCLMRCWLIGLLAGFPAAADNATRMVLSGEVSKQDAERCLAFTNNPGLVFVVCGVGSGMFGSFCTGIYLWLIQAVSAFLIAVLFAEPSNISHAVFTSSCPRISLKRVFPRAVVTSVDAVLNVCGFVVFFRTLIAVLTVALPYSPLRALLAGGLELTCGISALSEFSFLTAIMASIMLGWSGLSVHFQIMNVISTADLSPKYYFLGKFLQAFFSVCFAAGSYPLIFSSLRAEIKYAALMLVFGMVLIVLAIRIRREYLCKKRYLKRKNSVWIM